VVIDGKPAREVFRCDAWMATFYDVDGAMYLDVVFNLSAAYYTVVFRLTDEEVAKCQGPEAMTAFARQAINRSDYAARRTTDYHL
jgi:hypothetical protein